MSEFLFSNLETHAPPHLAPDLFDRMAPTLEGLRHTVLSLSRLESHPFAHLPPPEAELQRVRSRARALRREADLLVVAGIGGSSLGAQVLCSDRESRVVFLDGIDPAGLRRTLDSIPWPRAALNIVSKSGNTLETLVNAGFCLEALRGTDPDRWQRRVVVTASPGEGRLQRWAEAEGVARLDIPATVGGRYSVLTPVGLLPAAFDGIDPSALAAGAKRGADKSLLLQGAENPALALALILATLYAKGLTEVDLWGYGTRPYRFARWLQQLWGESLGRRIGEEGTHRVGPTPVACAGSQDQHSLLQLFVDGPPKRWVLFLTRDAHGPALSSAVRSFAGLPEGVHNAGAVQEALWRGTLGALEAADVPVARFHLGPGDAASLGEAFFIFQAATLYAAALFEVDPFGQPGVETGKRLTRELLRLDYPF